MAVGADLAQKLAKRLLDDADRTSTAGKAGEVPCAVPT